MATTNADEQQIFTEAAPQQSALIAAHAQRAAELRMQMLLMKIAVREPVQQKA